MSNKVSLMYNILQKVVDVLNKNSIPYYLDCGTLLGCIRENKIMKHDTDVDVSIHLSYWDKLDSIDFSNYGLCRTRTMNCHKTGYLISVKMDEDKSGIYCDIYANPSFPLLETKIMNNFNYCIPQNSDLYLTILYGDWKVYSTKHAAWPWLWYGGYEKGRGGSWEGGDLLKSAYSKYFDLDFEVKLNPRPVLNTKNLNKSFWNNYYKTNDVLSNQSPFAEFVHENYGKNCKNVLDLGCGNCRDSKFFSKNDIQVEAVDYNGYLDGDFDNIKLVKEDAGTYFYNKSTLYDLIYMRWFLHAMPYEHAKNIIKFSSHRLSKDGKICIEVRSMNDQTLIDNSVYDEHDLSYKTTHKRWLYSIETLENLYSSFNLKKIYMEEGYFSPCENTETDNPLLIRCILEKA